jgi:hypothetical protein
MSDDQFELFKEEDLALALNKLSRAMNNVRLKKRGGQIRCFECGELNHIRSHCPKLGRDKKDDNGAKTKDNNPTTTFKGRRSKEALKKVLNQVYAAFEPASDVDLESDEEDKSLEIEWREERKRDRDRVLAWSASMYF